MTDIEHNTGAQEDWRDRYMRLIDALDRYAQHGYSLEVASLAQQPAAAAVDGPYRMVDDAVTVNGIALDEVVELGSRYAATIEKRGMPRAAQVFEALVTIGRHALAGHRGGQA